jgi:hypothetical protein
MPHGPHGGKAADGGEQPDGAERSQREHYSFDRVHPIPPFLRASTLIFPWKMSTCALKRKFLTILTLARIFVKMFSALRSY